MLDELKTKYAAADAMSKNLASQVIEPEKVLNEKQKRQAGKLAKVFTWMNRFSYLFISAMIIIVILEWCSRSALMQTTPGVSELLVGMAALYLLFRLRDTFRGNTR